MKFFNANFWRCVLLLFFIPFSILGQNEEGGTKSKEELIKAAREIMAKVSTCALITIDSEGTPRARAMDPFPPEDDFTIWFGTNPKSKKVNQIRGNSKVTLYYLDKDETGYVTIHGKAMIVEEQVEKEKRWKNEWEAFYPNKSSDYALIKVSPIWIEVVSYKHGIVSQSRTWQAPSTDLNSD